MAPEVFFAPFSKVTDTRSDRLTKEEVTDKKPLLFLSQDLRWRGENETGETWRESTWSVSPVINKQISEEESREREDIKNWRDPFRNRWFIGWNLAEIEMRGGRGGKRLDRERQKIPEIISFLPPSHPAFLRSIQKEILSLCSVPLFRSCLWEVGKLLEETFLPPQHITPIYNENTTLPRDSSNDFDV